MGDFNKPKPTRVESALYELYTRHDALEKVVAAQSQMIYALMGTLEGQVEISDVMKTFHNKMRIETLKIKAMTAEMEVMKENQKPGADAKTDAAPPASKSGIVLAK